LERKKEGKEKRLKEGSVGSELVPYIRRKIETGL
jgi:hypothetical protein